MVALSELAVNGRSKEDAVEVILEELETTISHCHPEITRIEIKEALREQEVKTILDTYYLRGLVYEH